VISWWFFYNTMILRKIRAINLYLAIPLLNLKQRKYVSLQQGLMGFQLFKFHVERKRSERVYP
jgi:hypothetical protein